MNGNSVASEIAKQTGLKRSGATKRYSQAVGKNNIAYGMQFAGYKYDGDFHVKKAYGDTFEVIADSPECESKFKDILNVLNNLGLEIVSKGNNSIMFKIPLDKNKWSGANGSYRKGKWQLIKNYGRDGEYKLYNSDDENFVHNITAYNPSQAKYSADYFIEQFEKGEIMNSRSIKSGDMKIRYTDKGRVYSDSLDTYVYKNVKYKGDTYEWNDYDCLYYNTNGDEEDYMDINVFKDLPEGVTPVISSRKAIKSGMYNDLLEKGYNGYQVTKDDSGAWCVPELDLRFWAPDELIRYIDDNYSNDDDGIWDDDEIESSRKPIKSSSEPSIMIYIRNPETGKWASQAWCNTYQKDPYYYDRAEIIDNPAGYSDEERVIYWGDDINDAMCFSTPERAREYPLKGELYTAEDVPLLGIKLDTIQPLNNSRKPIKSSTGNLPKEVYYMVVQGTKMYYSTDYDKVKDMVLKMNSKSGPRVYGPYVEDDPEEIQELYEVGYLSNSRQIKSSVSINSLKEDLEGNFWTRKEDFEKDVASAGWDVEEMNSEYAVISNDYGSEYEIRFNRNGDGVSLTVKDVIPLLLEDNDDDLIDSSREPDSFDNGYDRNVRNINNILSR